MSRWKQLVRWSPVGAIAAVAILIVALTRSDKPSGAYAVALGISGSRTISGSTVPGPRRVATPTTFASAKRLMKDVYASHRVSFYCACSFDAAMHPDFASCGYQSARDTPRSRRIEWEHVVPAMAFGWSFVEWREGHPSCVDGKGKPFKGRRCARKASALFREMEADMHNLFPAIGELNARRGRFSMAVIEGEEREFGACDIEVAGRKIEPREAVRGDVARVYLHMDREYPGRGVISRKNRKLLREWSEVDPVDGWECERERKIEEIQLKENIVVKAACAQAGL